MVLKAFSLLWLSRSSEVHNASLRFFREPSDQGAAANRRVASRLQSARPVAAVAELLPLDDEELRTRSDATKEQSLGSVGGRRLIFLSRCSDAFSARHCARIQKSFRYAPSGVMALSEHGARIFGVLAVAVGLVIVWFYFYLRRAIVRDEEALQKPRWR